MTWSTRTVAAGACVLALVSASAHGALFDVQLDNTLVGTAKQSDVPAFDGPSGANSCTPTATANGFAYLQAKYPDVYGTLLVGTGSAADVTAAATTLASMPYMRTSFTSGTTADRWVFGYSKYPELIMPGRTEFGSMGNFLISTIIYPWHVNKLPTFNFLYDALVHESGVELGMFSSVGGVGHTLTLTGVHWDDTSEDGMIQRDENATMTYVDPLDGQVHSAGIWQVSMNGFMHTDYYVPGVDSGTLVMATWARPVPEPGTLAVLGIAVAGLMMRPRQGA